MPGAPYSASDSADPENLWRTMDGWRAKGIEAMAIPHNSNGSDGLMFDSVRLNGQPLDRAYADLRMRNEPLVEMTQIKGTSETHPSLATNDEWANFEIMESYIGQAKAITKFHGGYVRQGAQRPGTTPTPPARQPAQYSRRGAHPVWPVSGPRRTAALRSMRP